MGLVKSQRREEAFRAEIAEANHFYSRGELESAFRHAERAHVLGQPWAGHHTAAHWLMFKIGIARKDGREILGQVVRLAAGGLLTFIGRLPEGNTGGANVPPEKPMPLPPDLQKLCEP